MKILFDSLANLELEKFGISIPLTDRRVQNILDFLGQRAIPYTDISIHSSDKISAEILRLAHDEAYTNILLGDKVEKALENTFELYDLNGKPNRYDPLNASLPLKVLNKKIFRQINNTMIAAKMALEYGASFYLGGGFHHGMTFGGRGFCHVNDIVIASRYLQKFHGVGSIAIIDIDVHKGDGTAEIVADDPSIKTLSIHMAQGWPLDGPKYDEQGRLNPWFIDSDIDIPIFQGEESKYLSSLEQGLNQLGDLGPFDFVFVVQGSDPYSKDQLPSSSLIQLSLEEILQRDILVLEFVNSRNIPHCHLIAGGYGEFSHEPFTAFFSYLQPGSEIFP